MSDIWAGCALSRTSFVIAAGEMEDDPQFSLVATYSASAEEPWTFQKIDATIMSLTVSSEHGVVALGIDGDVFRIREDFDVGKIPNSGAVGDFDEEAPGSLETIRNVGGYFLVCGDGAQIFRSAEWGSWMPLGGPANEELGDASLNDVVANTAERIAVCGNAPAIFRQPTPEEKAELDQIEETGTLGDYADAADRFERMLRPPHGCLFVEHDKRWVGVELPGSGHLNAVHALPDDRFLAVGGGGMMVCGGDAFSFEDVSISGITDTLWAVQQLGDEVIVLTDTSLLVLSSNLELEQTIPLPESLQSPIEITVVDGVIWYFDHQGVARFESGTWEVLQLPGTVFAIDE